MAKIWPAKWPTAKLFEKWSGKRPGMEKIAKFVLSGHLPGHSSASLESRQKMVAGHFYAIIITTLFIIFILFFICDVLSCWSYLAMLATAPSGSDSLSRWDQKQTPSQEKLKQNKHKAAQRNENHIKKGNTSRNRGGRVIQSALSGTIFLWNLRNIDLFDPNWDHGGGAWPCSFTIGCAPYFLLGCRCCSLDCGCLRTFKKH